MRVFPPYNVQYILHPAICQVYIAFKLYIFHLTVLGCWCVV